MPFLSEEQLSEKISNMSAVDWGPLLALIPEIEKSLSFGRAVIGETAENGTLTMPYWVPGDIVLRFLKVFGSIPLLVRFDWPRWEEGRAMASDPDFDYDSVDIATICKIISAVMENDRFCDGALVNAFESGLILSLLKSIERRVKL